VDEFKSFDSLEDMFQYMADATDAANAGLAQEQKDLTWGSYFVNFQPQIDLVIFGRVFTEDEVAEDETKAGSDEAELAYTLTSLRENHEHGYLYGRCYSTIEPSGELGDTHRASAWPISKELFDAAQAVGWDVLTPTFDGLDALDAAYQSFRAHKLNQSE
jgi:hypothetical protein